MVASALKRIASHMPNAWQEELKRLHFRHQIESGKFRSPEPEYDMLRSFISPGDWAIDIGANVGHYTKRMSELVGPLGRVIAIEPVPETFSLLTGNARLFTYDNVTLINAAASNRMDTVGMAIPRFETGLLNYYQARITEESGCMTAMTFPLDALDIDRRVSLVKVDVEGHEAAVLSGMWRLIECCHPTLIIETESPEVVRCLEGCGYKSERLPGSPNILFR